MRPASDLIALARPTEDGGAGVASLSASAGVADVGSTKPDITDTGPSAGAVAGADARDLAVPWAAVLCAGAAAPAACFGATAWASIDADASDPGGAGVGSGAAGGGGAGPTPANTAVCTSVGGAVIGIGGEPSSSPAVSPASTSAGRPFVKAWADLAARAVSHGGCVVPGLDMVPVIACSTDCTEFGSCPGNRAGI
jgi:hypothetical protein